MKKLITISAAAAILASFAACPFLNGSKAFIAQQSTYLMSSKNTSPEQIEAAVANALGDGYSHIQPISEEELTLSIFNGLDLSKVESYVAKQTSQPENKRDMIAVFKSKHSYANQLVEILNSHYAQVVSNTMQNRYDVLKVNGTRIYRIGDTVMFILAGASPEDGASTDEEAALAEAEYAKIDGAIKKLFGYIPENLAEITMDPSWARGGNIQ